VLTQAAMFLADTIIGLFSLALLLRFYLQLVRAPYRNPISQFLCALTDFLVLPARRVIPGLWGMDLATLVLAWATQVLLVFVLLSLGTENLRSGMGTVIAAACLLSAIKIVKMSIYILMVAVIVQAILSWVNPYSPVMPLLNSLTAPFLRPLKKRVPTIANVDLSPLVLIIALQLVLMVPVAWLELNVGKLF
jgi:YggT family protein